jgi:hypothetical protein
MNRYERSDYDTSARFGARLSGIDFLKLILQAEFPIRLERWIDSRSQASAESDNLASDLIGFFRDLSTGGIPWCTIFEFKSRIDFEVVAQLYGYLAEHAYERPDELPAPCGSRI